jgi:hypothetical protein
MLAAIAAVALVAGAIGATVSVSHESGQTPQQTPKAVVEVHTVKSVNTSNE